MPRRNARPAAVCGLVSATFFAAVLTLPTFASPTSAQANDTRVYFDMVTLIGTRDVTPPSFTEMNPEERLVEVRLLISSLVRGGGEHDLLEYLYIIESPQRAAQIEDYLPKTTLATDVVGNMAIESSSSSTRNFGLNLKAKADAHAEGSATLGANNTNCEKQQYTRLPSLELLAASGTMNLGAAAYFKLKPSPRTSLEGAQEFVVVLRVPAAWRGDYLRVYCEAIGSERGVVKQFDERKRFGAGEFLLGLYAEGDATAKALASDMLRSEQLFKGSIMARREAIEKARYPGGLQKLGAAFSMVQPKIPERWHEQVLRSPGEAPLGSYARYLPDDVRLAAQQYLAAKSRLHQLCGHVTISAVAATK